MNFFDFLSVAIILTTFSFIFYLLYNKSIDDKQDQFDIVRSYSDTVKEISVAFMQEIAGVEKNHFEQVEKQSTKQLQILEKQTKDFIGVMEKFIEASKPPKEKITELISNLPERENTIAKEEEEEKSLEDIERIPIVNGINVQFEGQEEILPINIS